MDIAGIDHIQLAMPAGREAEARAFYGGLLGLPELAKPGPLQARGGCWFAVPGSQLHLGVEEGFAPQRKAHPALLVRDLEAARGELRDQFFQQGGLAGAGIAGDAKNLHGGILPAQAMNTGAKPPPGVRKLVVCP